MSRFLILVGLALLVPAAPARGDEEASSWPAVERSVRAAFKPIKVAAPARLGKEVRPNLPDSIEITAAPFKRLIDDLVRPLAERLAARERGMRSLAAHPSPRAGRLVEAALTTLAKEDRKVSDHVLEVEALYARVFRKGWMEASVGEREDRMLSAVLIPFYRRLLFRAEAAREAAVDALAALSEGESRTWLLGAAKTARDAGFRVAAVEALGRIRGDDAKAVLLTVRERDAVPLVRLRALAALLRWPVGEVADPLAAALADDAWEVRALAAAACARAKLYLAVPALIDALEKEDGRLRRDLEDALFALTGARMYGDVARWRRWWTEHEAEVQAAAKEQEASGAYGRVLGPPETWDDAEGREADDEEQRGGTTSFYGITTPSKRLLFVVDISRSMDSEASEAPPVAGAAGHPYREPRGRRKIDIARWQLHRVIHDLAEDAIFGVVVYSESYALWGKGMARATKREKKKAHAFVKGLDPNGTTNICDALDKALEMTPDTIFLLSDGDPNRGRVANLPALEEDVVRRAKRYGIVVHAVGIGEAAGSTFLKSVAGRTGGEYVGFP